MALVIPEHVAVARAKQKAKAALSTVPTIPRKTGLRRPFTVRLPSGQRSKIYIDVVHEVDPKQALLDRIGTIPERIVQHNKILVAIYQPPMIEKVGSVFITETLSDEDKLENLWQGKVGLVVAMGQRAYVDDDATKFYGEKVSVGDWVWFQPSNGQGCDVNEVFCRKFDVEGNINGVIPHPDYIW